MDPILIELGQVARKGDIDGLYGLLRNDPFILENVEKTPFIDTPLHLAVSDGHTCSVEELICFVEEITNLKPSFSWKLNQDGFSPLHLAASSGQLEIVKVLLKDECRLKKLMEAMNVDGSLYTLKGKEKRTPLHCAAIAGCVDVLEELLSNCPDSITALTVRKETALHLAVKFDRVEAFKVLVNWTGKHCYNGILRWKDQEGNTVLHLATSRAQYEMVKVMLHSSCLLVRKAVQVNARNNAGQTALDLLPSEPDRERIRTILCSAGAKKSVGANKEGHEIESQQVPAAKGKEIEGQQVSAARSSAVKWLPKSSKIKDWLRYFILKVDKDTPPDTRNALLVVVVLIVTATFQTGLNPPGGYWTETNRNDTRIDGGDMPHNAGEPIWSTYAPITYDLVMLFNFAGFILSVVLTYNLTQGYPLRGPLLVALIFMVLTYSWSTPIFDYEGTPNGPARRDFGKDPASSNIIAYGPANGTEYYFLDQNPSNNKMLWLPVVLVVIIWAITSNWMERIWWKFLLLTGRVSHD